MIAFYDGRRETKALVTRTAVPVRILKRWVGAAGPLAASAIVAVLRPNGLAVDGTSVYWTDLQNGSVLKCAVTGCSTPTKIACGLVTPVGIAVDATSVYWTDFFTGLVSKAPK
jgi:hypothetical protein